LTRIHSRSVELYLSYQTKSMANPCCGAFNHSHTRAVRSTSWGMTWSEWAEGQRYNSLSRTTSQARSVSEFAVGFIGSNPPSVRHDARPPTRVPKPSRGAATCRAARFRSLNSITQIPPDGSRGIVHRQPTPAAHKRLSGFLSRAPFAPRGARERGTKGEELRSSL